MISATALNFQENKYVLNLQLYSNTKSRKGESDLCYLPGHEYK